MNEVDTRALVISINDTDLQLINTSNFKISHINQDSYSTKTIYDLLDKYYILFIVSDSSADSVEILKSIVQVANDIKLFTIPILKIDKLTALGHKDIKDTNSILLTSKQLSNDELIVSNIINTLINSMSNLQDYELNPSLEKGNVLCDFEDINALLNNKTIIQYDSCVKVESKASYYAMQNLIESSKLLKDSSSVFINIEIHPTSLIEGIDSLDLLYGTRDDELIMHSIFLNEALTKNYAKVSLFTQDK